MNKTIVVLPDGTEISSGHDQAVVLKSSKITQMVNDGTELTLGSACSTMAELHFLTLNGSSVISANDEIVIYEEDKDGTRTKMGTFIAEKPVRSGMHEITVFAFDKMVLLDKDVTEWFSHYGYGTSLINFADMVCDICGLTLKHVKWHEDEEGMYPVFDYGEILNGDYATPNFYACGITGRKLMQWIGEIAGCFVRATVDGEIELAWYKENPIKIGAEGVPAVNISYVDGALVIDSEKVETDYDSSTQTLTINSDLIQVSDDGAGNLTLHVSDDSDQIFYYQSSLSSAEYAVAPIEKVQLRHNEADVGTIYPQVEGEANTYIITGNYLLAAETADDLVSIAENLYNRLSAVSYTPCTVSIPAALNINAGDIINITDKGGNTFPVYVMCKTHTGSRATLECTGSPRRDSSTALNDQTFKALNGKVLNLQTDVEGLRIENKDTAGRTSKLEMDVSNIRFEVTKIGNSQDSMQKSLTSLEQSSSDVKIQVEKIVKEGATTVKTGKGFVFNDTGLHISDPSNNQVKSTLDNTGMYVSRGYDNKPLLIANSSGVEAHDVTIRNFLIMGESSRFEDYTDANGTRRTACFWIGE